MVSPTQREPRVARPAAVSPAVNDNRAVWPAAAAAAAPPPVVAADALQVRYANLVTTLEPETGILWARLAPRDGACLTAGLLADVGHFMTWLCHEFAHCTAETMPFRWLVWTMAPGMAGLDLGTVATLLAARDEAGLRAHMALLTELQLALHRSLDLPVITVALVEGDVGGAAVDAALSCDLVVAERQGGFAHASTAARLPSFASFALLRRRLGASGARAVIGQSRRRSATEMRAHGLVDLVCEPGAGPATLRRHLAERAASWRVDVAAAHIAKRTEAIPPDLFLELADLWVDAAMGLKPAAVRALTRLARRRLPTTAVDRPRLGAAPAPLPQLRALRVGGWHPAAANGDEALAQGLA